VATSDLMEYGRASEAMEPGWYRAPDFPRQALGPVYCDPGRTDMMYFAGPPDRGVEVTIGNIGSLFGWGHEKFTFVPSKLKGPPAVVRYSKASALPQMKFLAELFSEEAIESSVTTAAELAEIVTDINSLAFQVEADDYGLVRPSYHAFKHCLKWILMLAQRGGLIKPSSITTDPNGAIRIVWESDDREAELVCPSEEDEMPYIYSSSSDEYKTDGDFGPEALMRKIRWAIGGE